MTLLNTLQFSKIYMYETVFIISFAKLCLIIIIIRWLLIHLPRCHIDVLRSRVIMVYDLAWIPALLVCCFLYSHVLSLNRRVGCFFYRQIQIARNIMLGLCLLLILIVATSGADPELNSIATGCDNREFMKTFLYQLVEIIMESPMMVRLSLRCEDHHSPLR